MHVAPIHRHVAHFAHWQHLPQRTDYGHLMPRIGSTHAARAGGPQGSTIADDVVELGLPKHFIQCHTERELGPLEYRFTYALACAHDRAQFERVVIARKGHALHHQFERGGEQKSAGDAVALHQRKRARGVESTAVADDGAAEIKRGQQRVTQTARPRPVGRRPEHIIWLRKLVMRINKSGQVAQ